MMANKDDSHPYEKPIQANSGRQAHDAIRGYVYQLWYTVKQWIELKPSELLYIEGAEDLDVSRSSHMHTKQIKDTRTSQGVSLNQKQAIHSLNAFWRLQKDNPKSNIYYSFVTSAAPVQEKGSSLTTKGIHLWHNCQNAPSEARYEDISTIAEFLRNHSNISSELKAFLANASLDDVHAWLIARFHWVTSEMPLSQLRDRIVAEIHSIGHPNSLTIQSATELANSLFSEVAQRASDKNAEPLTYLQFHQRLEAFTIVELPKQTVAHLEDLNQKLTNKLLESYHASESVPTVNNRTDFSVPPAASGPFFYRQKLHERLASSLNKGSLFVFSSSGHGKTTEIRRLVADRTNVYWVRLRNATSAQIEGLIADLLRGLYAGNEGPTVVLDDLELENDLRSLEDTLANLRDLLAQQTGLLLITSYAEPGPKLCSVLNIGHESIVEMPPFVEEEIADFLSEQGCHAEKLASLSRLTLIQTGGHAQLVSSRVRALRCAGFPAPTAQDLASEPADITNAKAEAAKLVRATLPEDARELLYRLSLALTPIGRHEALSIAEYDDRICRPGEAFANIEGLWLERIGEDEFRTSQLVDQLGQKIFGSEKIKTCHASISEVLLGRGTLEPGALSAILVHALSGKAETEFATAAAVFLQADEESQQALARWLTWVIYLEDGGHAIVPFETKFVRQITRFLQLEVARYTDPDKLEQLAHDSESDFCIELYEQSEVLARFMFLAKCILGQDIKVPIAKLVEYFVDLVYLYRWIESNISELNLLENLGSLRGPHLAASFEDLLLAALVPRLEEPSDIRELFGAISSLEEKTALEVVKLFPEEESELRAIFDGPYLQMKKGDRDKGREYIEILGQVWNFARRFGRNSMIRAAARAISLILEDIFNDTEKAKCVLSDALVRTGQSREMVDRFATICFNEGEYRKALGYWEKFLPGWEAAVWFSDPQPTFSRRNAGVAAANLGVFSQAISWLDAAKIEAAKFGGRQWMAGLFADVGFVRWEKGDKCQAVRDLADAVRSCVELPKAPEARSEHAVQKLVGHTLTFISDEGLGLAKPPFGSCSTLAPHPEIAELGATPDAFLWFSLYKVAHRAGSHDVCFEAVSHLEQSEYAFLRFAGIEYRLHRKIRSGEVGDVPLLGEEAAKEWVFSLMTRDRAPTEPDPEDVTITYTKENMSDVLVPVLIAAIWKRVVDGGDAKELMAEWEGCRVTSSACDWLLEWVAAYARAESKGLREILKDSARGCWDRLLAAALIMNSSDVGPDHLLYAQAYLCRSRKLFGPMEETAGELLSQTAKRAWVRLCRVPALFVTPRNSVSQILEACDASEDGWEVVAAIILSARSGSRLKIPGETLRDIRSLVRE